LKETLRQYVAFVLWKRHSSNMLFLAFERDPCNSFLQSIWIDSVDNRYWEIFCCKVSNNSLSLLLDVVYL
jgi:hypothetical protein